MQHAVEPVRQCIARRYFIGNVGCLDLRLGTDDPLRQGRGRGEVSASDLLCRQATHFAQREGDLRIRRQSRMTTCEDQPQPIIFHLFILPRSVVFGCVEPVGNLDLGCVKARAAADAVDGLEAAGRYEPRAGIRRHTLARPLLHGCTKGFVQRFLRQVEITQHANQCGEHTA